MDAYKLIDDVAREIAELPTKPTEDIVRQILTARLQRAGLEVLAEEVMQGLCAGGVQIGVLPCEKCGATEDDKCPYETPN